VVGFALGGVLGGVTGLVVTLSAGALLRVLAGVLALLFLPREEPALTGAVDAAVEIAAATGESA